MEKNQHLYFLKGTERERETIERLFLTPYGQQGLSSHIAGRHNIHPENHVLITDIRFESINPSCPVNGDIDLLLLPCRMRDTGYENGLTELTYDYSRMLLLEVKTTLAGKGNRISSSKLNPKKQSSLIGQLKKYQRLGFYRCAVAHLFIGEPLVFTDSTGQTIQDTRAVLASSDIPIHCAKQKLLGAADTDGTIEIPHYAIAIGSVPGHSEAAHSSIHVNASILHRVQQQAITYDLRADVERLLVSVLPTTWGIKNDFRFHPMPIVRECQACHHLFIQHRWYQYGRVCRSCLTLDNGDKRTF